MYARYGGQMGFNETPEETLAIRDKLVAIARSNAQTLDTGPCFEYPTPRGLPQEQEELMAAGYRGGCGPRSGNIMQPSSYLTNGEYDNNMYGEGYRRRPARKRAHRIMRRRLGPRTVGGRRRRRAAPKRRAVGGRRRATTRRRTSKRGGSYMSFVRSNVNRMPGSTPQQRMAQVARAWRGARLHPRGRALLY
jgi:hypothetical protein